MNILSSILADKRSAVAEKKAACSLSSLREQADSLPPPPKMVEALAAAPIGLIAEVKHRSPSAGVIRSPFVPAEIAQAYEVGGAHALSVLMDEPYFGGGEAHFREARAAVALPMLYKEFVVDAWQVWHARLLGASTVLLIASALKEREAAFLMETCSEAGLEVLFEVHDAEEMEVARRLNPGMVGINNRNLKTFVTTLETTRMLQDRAPEGALLISESGIRTHDDVARLQSWGIDGLLVGEHLLREENLSGAVRHLLGTA